MRQGVRNWRVWCGLLGGLSLAACAPTFNWRLVPFESTPVQAMLPCKPERASREVPTPSQSKTQLQMASCDVDDQVFALSVMAWPVPNPSPEALATAARQWLRAHWARLGVMPPADTDMPTGWQASPWQVKDAEWSGVWQGPAKDHQGRVIQAQLGLTYQNGVWLQLGQYSPKFDLTAWEAMRDAVQWNR